MKLREQLLKRCRASKETFASLGTTIQTKHGPLTHIDNGSNILAVAHLDWVMWRKPKIKNNTVYCPQLDDRLGVWTILDILPYLGINVDVLLTDSEECGQSTAQYFESPKEYNWMFQFDRAGTDVVMYEYETTEHEKRLTDVGFKVGFGSYSDICKLNHLKITGFNFGVGYHCQHTESCYANLKETASCVKLFQKFYNKHKDEVYPWVEDVNRWQRKSYNFGYYTGKNEPYVGPTANRSLIPYNSHRGEVYNSYDDYYKDTNKFKLQYLDLLAVENGYIDGTDFMSENHIYTVQDAIYELEYNAHLYNFNYDMHTNSSGILTDEISDR